MAIYHLSIKIISRGKGKSAVAAAAYRAGETITNEYDGITHDYSRKGGVVHAEIFPAENAPEEYRNRAVLWNAVEKAERYDNAQLAREIEIALPVELTREQNISLARRYVLEQFVSAGMCADVCVHDPDRETPNPHAHIMLTMRPIERGGEWGAKSKTVNGRKVNTVDWNDREKAEDWRKAWAVCCNDALRANGHDAGLDHRSYERQGIEQIPTVHLGVAATRMERKGIRTERGDLNRETEFTNKQIRQLRARINKVKDWLKEEAENPAPPTLADIISDILSDGESKT
ncbi:MAG: MobA/MobL family protein, partial [Clostridiales Family XIII bacterium]|nr:MobA/MobL family protein [Clostridiales Family XIII bacterium]